MSNPTTVRYLFDFASPNCFFAHKVIPAIEERTGVTFEYEPVLLGGLFKLTGNQPPFVAFGQVKGKVEYMQRETARFIDRHQITDYTFNPHFPLNTLFLMRSAVYAKRTDADLFKRTVDAFFHYMWVEPKKMDDPEVIVAALAESGLDPQEFLAGSQDAEVKQELIDRTEAAVEAGAFGAPSFLIGDELFFGKDSLRDVEEWVTR